MIDKSTIDKIFNTADVVEVVRDFVNLKKAGTNYSGLCPFHSEKTPSFSVSPSRGIYKCFGCGKGGNVVNFIMDHEQLSYYEALKYLAQKYQIDIRETEETAEDIEQKNEIESLLIVTSFAQKHFTHNLLHTNEGRSVGLSYLKERGFREPVIEKFQLGYSLDQWTGFTKEAEKNGYKTDYLVKTGLTIQKEANKKYDRFRGRVMFPIHSISGQIIGFGGRTLKQDEKTAKYLNSPESSIYHKSQSLYGIYQAKKAMVKADKCYLVEGYTDVIAFHQTGIENVVASSGTSLTEEQIRIIKRFTHNITVIYDGDEAGLKASLRGIDIILEQGMNVKVLVLPEGEDPDSYAQSNNASNMQAYLDQNEQDFITFKTNLLMKDAQNDPAKKANLISNIVASIAVIPDSISRSVYLKECSNLLSVNEQVLYTEVNKKRRQKFEQKKKTSAPKNQEQKSTATAEAPVSKTADMNQQSTMLIEKEIIRLMIQYGNDDCFTETIEEEEGLSSERTYTVVEYVMKELYEKDEIEFEHPGCRKIFLHFRELYQQNAEIDAQTFTHHPDPEISKLAADLMATHYTLSNIWKRKDNLIETEDMRVEKVVYESVLSYKNRKIIKAMEDIRKQLKEAQEQNHTDQILQLQKQFIHLNEKKKELAKALGERAVM